MKEEQIILVDESDNPIGTMGKMEVHQRGLLHRAFSIFIFNNKKEMLLQKRALTKYHSAGLWSNACCSHPKPDENTLVAANRRLFEEMGMRSVLKHQTSFIYKTAFENNLTEHELDHVYIGYSNEDPVINKEEVAGFKWVGVEELKNEIKITPHNFTSWFKIAMERIF